MFSAISHLGNDYTLRLHSKISYVRNKGLLSFKNHGCVEFAFKVDDKLLTTIYQFKQGQLTLNIIVFTQF